MSNKRYSKSNTKDEGCPRQFRPCFARKLLIIIDLYDYCTARSYSDSSGCRLAPSPPTAFFSQYFRTQASQLLPAAGSRPLKASAAMSEYAIFSRPPPCFGKILTNESLSVVPLTLSK